MKTGKLEELQNALLKWFETAKENGPVLSGNVLLEKANMYAKMLDIPDIYASRLSPDGSQDIKKGMVLRLMLFMGSQNL